MVLRVWTACHKSLLFQLAGNKGHTTGGDEGITIDLRRCELPGRMSSQRGQDTVAGQ